MKVKLNNVLLRVAIVVLIAMALLFGLAPLDATAEEAKAAAGGGEHHDMGEIGAKLSNPLANLWSLSMNFETPKFFDGDINTGDPKVGADMIFQPVMPIPLYGEGKAAWRMITRPVIPIIFSQPVPQGVDEFDHKGGIGDIQFPMLLAVPAKYAGHWIIGGGPVFMFPTATDDALGNDQWGLGPAVVLGYKTKKFTAVLFPNYFWNIGDAGKADSTPDLDQGSILYALTLNLPGGWQAGTNPTITFNNNASSGNKWNVPVGVFVGKTIMVGKFPVNIKVGLEYSVISEDNFGKETVFRFQITPVVPSLLKNPIFGS
jgi:hypothetical protein